MSNPVSDRLFSMFAYRHGDSFAASPGRRVAVVVVGLVGVAAARSAHL